MTDAPGERAYPITAPLFILMPKQPKWPERAKVALDLFGLGSEERAEAGRSSRVRSVATKPCGSNRELLEDGVCNVTGSVCLPSKDVIF
jgi:hypothetical protein